jgi:hypothetical protein
MRAVVRAAVASYLGAQSIPFLGTIHTARPFLIPEDDYDSQISNWALQLNPPVGDNRSGCVMIIHIPDSQRSRVSLSGRAFIEDTDVHTVVLEMLFANQSGDGEIAQGEHDILMDATVMAIRADPLLGMPGTIWSAGEFQQGVHVTQHEPFWSQDGLTEFIVALIRFDTWEWLSGPAGTT